MTNISESWIRAPDGEGGWTPFDIVGQLTHTDKTNWIERTKIFFSEDGNKVFSLLRRDTMIAENKTKQISELVSEFTSVRKQKIDALKAMNISSFDLDRQAIHPTDGLVKLRQLLSAWLVHDLSHLAQIFRAMSKQYSDDVGSWIKYLKILKN
ncbi:MAG: DinB family protein [Candidatus Heimdallarchaeota archaeon]|nr:DinB family protein [Candidatus Heimdallarchaeota archaeon]